MAKTTQGTSEQGLPAARELLEDAAALYETDFCAWGLQQAAELKKVAGTLQAEYPGVDWDNLIAELAAPAKTDKAAWQSNCREAILHMLTILHARGELVKAWTFEHWRNEVANAFRKNMHEALEGNDGLKGELLHCLGEAWRDGRSGAIERLTNENYFKGTNSEREDRRAQLERLIPVRCLWELGEVAGYNPLAKGEHPGEPSDVVWPREVARRLNDELGTALYDRGWTASGYPGYLEKRDGRPPNPRNLPPLTMAEQSADPDRDTTRGQDSVVDIPRWDAERDRQSTEREPDLGPSR